MQYRKLGSSDLNVSAVGLGTNNFGGRLPDQAVSARVVHEAIDLGVNLIDTAIGYGGGESEVHVGNATKDRRDEVLIATKFRAEVPKGKTFAQHLFDQCETSLASLQTDYIHLYQLVKFIDCIQFKAKNYRSLHPYKRRVGTSLSSCS